MLLFAVVHGNVCCDVTEYGNLLHGMLYCIVQSNLINQKGPMTNAEPILEKNLVLSSVLADTHAGRGKCDFTGLKTILYMLELG